jgi:menaquinone-dependent protoporphyrinogen oxidase
VPSKVLVAYATKHGSTAEIAHIVADTLASAGFEASLVPAGDVSDVRGFDAVVVGSAVYHGRWQGAATSLLKRFERDLTSRPVYLFSSGPTGGTPEADEKVAAALASPPGVVPPDDVAKRAARIRAREHVTFPGRVDDDMTGLLERWMPRGDWRDLNAVHSWAESIAAALPEPSRNGGRG